MKLENKKRMWIVLLHGIIQEEGRGLMTVEGHSMAR